VTIRCFLLEPTGRTVRALRRYISSSSERKCTPGGFGYCNASVPLDVLDGTGHASGDNLPHDDPRWPVACAHCGRPFEPGDEWQVFHEHEMRRSDTGELTTIRKAPAGAMWFADWLAGHCEGADQKARRPGQPHLIVKTPAGDWDVDGPSSNGNGWTRDGAAPTVTANPSILIDRSSNYHGWLRNGHLVEC
jgi:hypothetical protein